MSVSINVVGVDVDGVVDWHVPGAGGADDAILCGLDANDPAIDQTGFVPAQRGMRIDCRKCHMIWEGVRLLKLRESDFAAAVRAAP